MQFAKRIPETRPRASAVLSALAIALLAAPVAAVPAHAATGTMDIGGQIQVSLATDQAGTGWTWTAATDTLSLDSTYPGSRIGFWGEADTINLVYSGDVAVGDTTGSSAIIAYGGLNIAGSGGTLSLSSNGFVLTAQKSLNITGGTLNVVATGANAGTVTVLDGSFTMSGGTLNIMTPGGGASQGLRTQSGGDISITGTATVTTTTPTGAHAIAADGEVWIGGNATVSVASSGNPGISGASIHISGGAVHVKGTGGFGALFGFPGGVDVTAGTLTVGESGGSNGDMGGRYYPANLTVDNPAIVAVYGNVWGDTTISGGAVTITGTVSGTTTHTGGTLNGNGPGGAFGTLSIAGSTGLSLAADHTGTGWTWTAATATLALDGAYTTQPIAIDCQRNDAIGLIYTGDVTVASDTTDAVFTAGSLTITDNGSGGTLTLRYTGGGSNGGLYTHRDLTISGGTVNVESSGTGTEFSSSAAIWTAMVTIDGDANVTAETSGRDAIGIAAEQGDISISTSGTVTARGRGTGYALYIANPGPYRIDIAGGTVNLRGTPVGEDFVDITGGTVNAWDGSHAVYLVTLDGLSPNTLVTEVTAPAGYRVDPGRTRTTGDGKLCLWLPEGSLTIVVEADPHNYTVTTTVAANHTNAATMTPLPDNTTVTIAAIPGLTSPVTGATPVTGVETAQYTGTVTWLDAESWQLLEGTFAADTVYQAWITLTARPGHTFLGLPVDFFSVAGAAPVTSNPNAGYVYATFPQTGPAPPTTGPPQDDGPKTASPPDGTSAPDPNPNGTGTPTPNESPTPNEAPAPTPGETGDPDRDPRVPTISRLATTFATVVIPKGGSLKVPVAVTAGPGGPAGKTAVRWTSSAARTATVVKGKKTGTLAWTAPGRGTLTVRALKTGTAKITLTAPGAKRLVLTVKVVAKAKALRVTKTAIATKARSLRVGQSVTLKAVAAPAGAAKAVAAWKSTKPAVASVDAAGKVTALAKGRTVIVLKVGGKTTTRTLTVK
ncbi:MAG: Ig-like domain-containing protein [Bifidobacteriaceae bacterium]|jgi:hypothetical protein|nr:Ig-like domain-containing protein [Bifidobacteriaceae bacterium]